MTAFEILVLAALAFVAVLLLTLLLRRPASPPGLDDRLNAQAAALARLEGSLQASAGAQEARLQGLAQGTAQALETLREAVEQKLTQALADARAGRAELTQSFATFEQRAAAQATEREAAHTARAEALEKRLGESLAQLTDTQQKTLAALRSEIDGRLATMTAALREQLDGNGLQLKNQLSMLQEGIVQQLAALNQASQQHAEQLRATLNERLAAIQTDNANRLEEMRKTVDEKLHATLEQRLGQSFQLVSERLELVHRGLGEMQTLAAGVGDLKRVLTNVKTRGVWGEVQLIAMIEQIFTPEQFATNVATRPNSSERVEVAIRLPGGGDHRPVWLPIDAKFPVEDYQRLLDAHERADAEAAEAAAKALEARLRTEARTIREKYVEPPYTTDFAILYLPAEGLYAEALRRPGLAESLQRELRVVLAGPTNLAALLNSLQMGFRTLAIEKRASEVWQVLGQVKTEFAKFGEVLEKTKTKLDQARSQFDQIGVRSRAIERKLRDVEALPLAEGSDLIAPPADE
jgi:DNA recombination protein RmuC